MSCPNCDSTNIHRKIGKKYKMEEYPELDIIDVVILCNDCGFGFNCRGTKEKNNKYIKE